MICYNLLFNGFYYVFIVVDSCFIENDIYTYILGAIHKSHKSFPIDQFENVIGRFLKHAPSKKGGYRYKVNRHYPRLLNHQIGRDYTEHHISLSLLIEMM